MASTNASPARPRRRWGKIVIAQDIEHKVDEQVLGVFVLAGGRRPVPPFPTVSLCHLTAVSEAPITTDAVCSVGRPVYWSPLNRPPGLMPDTKLPSMHWNLEVFVKELPQALSGGHSMAGGYAHEN